MEVRDLDEKQKRKRIIWYYKRELSVRWTDKIGNKKNDHLYGAIWEEKESD